MRDGCASEERGRGRGYKPGRWSSSWGPSVLGTYRSTSESATIVKKNGEENEHVRKRDHYKYVRTWWLWKIIKMVLPVLFFYYYFVFVFWRLQSIRAVASSQTLPWHMASINKYIKTKTQKKTNNNYADIILHVDQTRN